MKRFLIVLALSVFSTVVLADTRNEKIKSLMEAQGLLEMFEQQLAMGAIHGQEAGREMIDQMTSQLNMTPEFAKRFESALNDFIKKVETPWTAEQIVEVWGKYYGKHFTDQDLEELLRFYKSPIGQKEVAASKTALIEFSSHFQELGGPVMEQAFQEYVAKLQQLVESCKCEKN